KIQTHQVTAHGDLYERDGVRYLVVTQVADDKGKRWAGKHGDSLYMCYCETHDLGEMIARLDANGARWTPRGDSQDDERDGLWVHPSATNGLLLGVSRTTLAWDWSGRPELIHPTAARGGRT
ncbi:MAG: hypothetical protein QF491_02010, partial [Alphaproteobacteria bacterium]|nr:hypothetical protein [Alphaproteobacteria bacterium]